MNLPLYFRTAFRITVFILLYLKSSGKWGWERAIFLPLNNFKSRPFQHPKRPSQIFSFLPLWYPRRLLVLSFIYSADIPGRINSVINVLIFLHAHILKWGPILELSLSRRELLTKSLTHPRCQMDAKLSLLIISYSVAWANSIAGLWDSYADNLCLERSL